METGGRTWRCIGMGLGLSFDPLTVVLQRRLGEDYRRTYQYRPITTETGKRISPYTATVSGLYAALWMEHKPRWVGEECLRISLYRQTMMETATRTYRCTEMAHGLFCDPRMEE